VNEKKDLILLQMNDLHAYLEPHIERFWGPNGAEFRQAGGLARIAGLMNSIRREAPGAVLAFDCGDTFHGTHAAVTSRGQALIPSLNRLGLNAMTGHWDFAYGPERLKELVAQLNYPLLAANCFDEESGELVFPGAQLYEAAGQRVGVIGLAAVIVGHMPEEFHRGIRLTLGIEDLPGHIERLRAEEKADLIVVISHLGFPQDMKLADEIPGIDVLLSAHTHNRLTRPAIVGRTIVIQSGSHGSFIGRLSLEVDNGLVVDFDHNMITIDDSIDADPVVDEEVQRVLAPARDELAQVVGYTATALHRDNVLESPMDNLLLESLIASTGAPLAFSNGWRYGIPIPPGPVTLNDLWNIIPVNPPVSMIELSGEEIWRMLEENLEAVFARNPYDQKGGYVKRALGLKAYVKLENPHTQRLQALFIGDEPVRQDKNYTAAFVTAQGVPKKFGQSRRNLDFDAITALREYLAPSRDGRSPLAIKRRRTFVVV
jgi:S-sulfosulfanyl-L-cysteine sulfohydrolase